MKVLVMGDCHLKPWMFKRAEELMEEYEIFLLEIWWTIGRNSIQLKHI